MLLTGHAMLASDPSFDALPPARLSPRAPRPAVVGLALAGVLLFALGGCGGAPSTGGSASSGGGQATGASANSTVHTTPRRRPVRRVPAYPVVLTAGLRQPGKNFAPIVTLHGSVAAWIGQQAGVTLVRFGQRLVHLALHAGSIDPGVGGWYYGDRVTGAELHHLVAAFNGGFRLNTGSGGFQAQGHTAVALRPGLGSVVTYTDGTTQIGSWQAGVPTPGRTIASVRQNLQLLIDGGAPAANVNGCALTCWGATLGGGVNVPRSALGITGNGDLVYAAGASLSPGQLASVMVAGGVQRAVELDINPQWVAGYVYVHRGVGGPVAMQLIPGQVGIAGFFLQPYSRDFFTIVAR